MNFQRFFSLISFFFAVVALHNSVKILFIQLLQLAGLVIVSPFFHFFTFVYKAIRDSGILPFLFIYFYNFVFMHKFGAIQRITLYFINFGKHNYV